LYNKTKEEKIKRNKTARNDTSETGPERNSSVRNGGNSMKRMKWIAAILTVAVLCLIGIAALADGEVFSLRVVNGTLDNDQYTGSYYYKIYIDNIPEGAEGVQIGYGAADASEPEDPWTYPVGRLRRDSGGLFTISLPEDESAPNQTDAFFARMGDDDPWLKAVLVYDTTKKNGNAVEITSTANPALNEDYTITWTDSATGKADAYIVYWKMPNDENPIGFFISGENENGTKRDSLSLFGQGMFGDVYDLTRYVGDYEVWVETYAGDQVGASAHQPLTIGWPDDSGEPQLHIMSSAADENGVITAKIYGLVKVTVTADEELPGNSGKISGL
jgi:hypothetical protein